MYRTTQVSPHRGAIVEILKPMAAHFQAVGFDERNFPGETDQTGHQIDKAPLLLAIVPGQSPIHHDGGAGDVIRVGRRQKSGDTGYIANLP
jgi:hypothetical protein